MSNNKFLSDYVYLAEVCYADFSKTDFSNKDKVIEAIKNSDSPQNLATLVTDHYKVVAHWKDRGVLLNPFSESGFSGTLFQGKDSTPNAGKYVIAMRDTEPGYTDIWATDISDIVHDGLAHHQIVDMYHF